MDGFTKVCINSPVPLCQILSPVRSKPKFHVQDRDYMVCLLLDFSHGLDGKDFAYCGFIHEFCGLDFVTVPLTC